MVSMLDSSQSSGFVFVAKARIFAFFQDGLLWPLRIRLIYASDIPDFFDSVVWIPLFMAAILTKN